MPEASVEEYAMRMSRRIKLSLSVRLAIAGLAASQGSVVAQDRVVATAANKSDESAANLRELLNSIAQLKDQVQTVNTRLSEVASAQLRGEAEAQQLRQELQAAARRIEALESASPDSGPSVGNQPVAVPPPPPVSHAESRLISFGQQEAKPPETLDERLSRIEENAQFLDAKVADQDQAKIESSAKYRLRFSGIFLLNFYGNIGYVNNQDFPELAIGPPPLAGSNAFGGSLRQSQIGVEGFGPDLAGGRTSASLRFDFAGNQLEESNGALMGGARLRTGVFRLDWKNTSLVAGQDVLFFVPLSPTSLASLAVPAFSYSGNLWGWAPQVRAEHRFTVTENTSFLLAGGILDQLTGDIPSPGQDRAPSWGEQSGQPGYATRVAWQQKSGALSWTLGGGGYYGRQIWGFGRAVDSWAGTVDLRVPITAFAEFSSALYRGRALGGFGGGIAQSVLFSGDPPNPSSNVHGLDSIGGWWQLKLKPKSYFEINTAFGIDNPFASQMRQFPVVPSEYDEPLAKNQTWLLNFIYQTRSNILLSLEYRRISSRELAGDYYDANHINLSLGYIF
jgi:hypothetical protein